MSISVFALEGSDASQTQSRAFVPLQPFRINNNAELQAAAVANSWSGSGTESSPYLITGYEVNSLGAPAGMYFGNTTLHFAVTSCWIHGIALDGLRLLGVANASVTGNTISGISAGAFVSFSRNCTFSNNTFTKCGQYGLELMTSRLLTVSNNTFDATQTGIESNICTASSILSNTVYNCTVSAIGLAGSTSMTISGNSMTGCGIVVSGQNRNSWATHTIDDTNTVNGNAVYYAANVDGAVAPAGAGQIILGGAANITVEGQSIHDASVGFQAGFSSFIRIANSTFTNDTIGISFDGSNDLVVYNNSISSGDYGLRFFSSQVLDVHSNSITNSLRAGIQILSTESGSFSMNSLTNCGFLMDGAVLSQWITHTIDILNTVNGKPVMYAAGADFEYIIATPYGQVILADSQGATIAGADIRRASSPIIFGFCSSSIVTASNCSESNVGVTILRSTGTVIDGSSMWNNGYGISLSLSPDTAISNCRLGDDPIAGIYALQSPRMSTANVSMFMSGFWLEGFTFNDFGSHSIGTDTTVNGKPVYYLVNQTGLTVPFPAGQVILANCSNIIVSDQDLGGSCIGVHINFCTNITVSNVTSTSNLDGLEMLECSNSLVENSSFAGNVYGIVADGSSGNEFRNNVVSGSSSWGLYFSESTSGNLVWNNTISNNRGSWGVFDPLLIQAFDMGTGNMWNSTRGNYWSDWKAPDSNMDGVVDLPYFLDGSMTARDGVPQTQPPAIIPELVALVPVVITVAVVLGVLSGLTTRKGRTRNGI